MNILVIATYYAPDLGPDAALYEMLCEDLAGMGHKITVLCTVPHYPTGRVASDFRGRMVIRECRNGVDVIRVWVPSVDRSRLTQRMLVFLVFQLLSTIVGMRHRCDVVIGTNPALEIFLPFQILGVLRRRRRIYCVQDLYPEAGIKLGIFRSRAIIRLVKMIEDRCLFGSDYVRVLSENFAHSMRARGMPDDRLALIFDWIDSDFIQPQPRDNAFSREWGLDRHFVVQYAGNIGLSQGLESVIEAARMLADEPAIRFAFVGDGAAKERLQNASAASALRNISFIPFQPRNRLPEVLASADVATVILKRGLSSDSVPSKLYSILAAARPVIASVDRESDTWRLINRANCGLCVAPESPRALSEAILALYHDEELRARFGRAGREYVAANHSRQIAARQFDSLIRALSPN